MPAWKKAPKLTGMREPIRAAELAEAIRPWRLDLREQTGSTNADAAAAAREGASEGLVVLAESQLTGRGRMGRTWLAPPRAGLALSLLLRPRVPMPRWGWLPLVAGIALTDTIPGSGLKWPNDLLLNGRKCAGILVEAVAGAAIVGIGLNVSLTHEELAGLPATSLGLEGMEADRTELAITLIERFKQRYDDWVNEDPFEGYLAKCRTIGREVRILLPNDAELTGTATTIDADGRLVVRTPDGKLCPIAAGDVTHVR